MRTIKKVKRGQQNISVVFASGTWPLIWTHVKNRPNPHIITCCFIVGRIYQTTSHCAVLKCTFYQIASQDLNVSCIFLRKAGRTTSLGKSFVHIPIQMFWFQQGLCILPVLLVISSSTTFIISYIIATLRHDAAVVLPYISDTANSPPESCFFGLMTIVSGYAGVSTIYAMYKYMDQLGVNTGLVSTCFNKAAFALGIISCFGMCIVATFQETAVEVVHLLGALLFFLCGTLYISLVTYLSYCSYPYGTSLLTCHTRLAICLISVVVFFPTVICKFYDKDPQFQKISAACEWIVAFSFVGFFLTYIHDFKRFTLKVKTVCGTGN